MGSITTVNYPDPGFWTKTSLIQLGYGLWISLPLTITGMAAGILKVLPVKLFDKTWLGTSMTLTYPLACIVSGFIIDKYGRKKMMIYSEIPVLLGWLSLAFAGSTTTTIIGKLMAGVGTGLSLVPPRVYATELSLPNMRPVVSSCPNIAFSTGLLLQHWLTSIIDLSTICLGMTAMTALTIFSLIFLPESPYFILMTDTEEKTKECLQQFRYQSHSIDAEIDELMEFKSTNSIRSLKIIESSKLMITPAVFIPFSIIMAYVFLAQMSGVSVFVSWAMEMFKDSETLIDSYTGKAILQVIRVVFGIVSAGLLYRFGYKVLSISSGIGIVCSCFTLGTLLIHLPKSSLFPQVCYIAYVIAETIGYFSLPTILMGELYPLQVRGILCGITLSLINIMIFFSKKLHSFLKHHLGLSSTVYYYGVIALAGCIVLYFIIPDTFNLTLQEIEEYYKHTRPTLVSQRQQMAAELAKVASGKSLRKSTSKKSHHQRGLEHYNLRSNSSIVGATTSSFASRSTIL